MCDQPQHQGGSVETRRVRAASVRASYSAMHDELIRDAKGDEVAFARWIGQRVSVGSPAGAPDDRGVRNVLAEKRGGVWCVEGQFGFAPGLCSRTWSAGRAESRSRCRWQCGSCQGRR